MEKERKFLVISVLENISESIGLPFLLFSVLFLGVISLGGLNALAYLMGSPLWSDWRLQLALLWLPLSPFFIRMSENKFENLWGGISSIVEDKKKLSEIKKSELNRFYSSKNLLIGIPLGAIVSLIIFSHYSGALPLPVLIYNSFLFFLILVFAGIGFWAIGTLIHTVLQITDLPMELQALKIERFGGLSVVGDVILKGTILFSTGSLLFPLALEILIGSGGSPVLRLFSFCIVGGYTFLIILSFIIPVLALKNCAREAKKRLVKEAANNFQSKLNKYKKDQHLDHEESSELLLLLNMFQEARGIKEYPYDLKTIFSFLASALFPTVMIFIDKIVSALTP